jgi:hypothetical protein
MAHFELCVQNTKTFFLEMRNPDFGTLNRAEIILLHPSKMRKPFSGKQETPILGHRAAPCGSIWPLFSNMVSQR